MKSSLENSLGNYCLRKEEEERKRKKKKWRWVVEVNLLGSTLTRKADTRIQLGIFMSVFWVE